jgi:TetR/AcrR family transcriptional regulator, regulator of autoinduction and epiphytic fitness
MKKRSRPVNRPRRRYRSPLRAEQARRTRLAILEAARRLFVAQGYAATSIRDIASAAGVAESTTYNVFKDKPTLLWEIAQHAVEAPGEAGAGAALLAAIRSEPDASGRLRLIARWSRETYERGIAEIEAVIGEAARSDPRVRALAERAAAERYTVTRMLADVVAEVLPPVDAAELNRIAQFIWATDSSPVYRMLVDQQGWTPARYEEWIYRLYLSVIPANSGGTAP